MTYVGPGAYKHYKGGLYDIFGLALWEPMADKEDNDVKLAENLVDFANAFDATYWDSVSLDQIERDRAMLLRAAALLSEDKFVIYEPMSPGSLLEGLPGVRFWARGLTDFNMFVPRHEDASTIGDGMPQPDRIPRFDWIGDTLPR